MARLEVDRETAMEAARENLGPTAKDMAEHAEDEIVGLMQRDTPEGEEYVDPEGGTYVASAPGEPPSSERTGRYMRSYRSVGPITRGDRIVAAVSSDRMVGPNSSTPLWAVLEFGTFRVAPRPHVRPGAEKAAEDFRAAAESVSR